MTAIITCKGKSEVMGKLMERHDIVVVDKYSHASVTPKLFAVFLPKGTEFAIALIKQSQVFCVNFVSGHAASIAFCKRMPGDHVDKFKETDFIISECEMIDCPKISQADSYLECELTETQTVGDHVMLVGKIRKEGL